MSVLARYSCDKLKIERMCYIKSTMEIIRILLPLVIVGGIAVFVVTRLKNKSKKGTLDKKIQKMLRFYWIA